MKNRARELRKNQTDAEQRLWRNLRNFQLEGCKFRRQVVVGNYIVDFLCLEPKLIVEVDGGQHIDQYEYDQVRTKYLASLGYQVIRFWNNDVLGNSQAVLEKIREEILRFPHPDLLPEGEGEEPGKV